MKRKLLCILVLCSLGLACSQGDKPDADIEVVDGIALVHNVETPLFPNRTVVFEEELGISSEDEAGNIILFQPSQFTVDDLGNIYICDQQDFVIKVFDPQGKLIRSFGKKGEGPGEFQGILGMSFLPDGRMLLTDTSLRRSNLFDGSGNFLSSHKWRGFLLDLYLTTDTAYIANETIFGQPSRMFVKKFDFEGNELLSLGEFKPMGIKMLRSGDSMFAITLPYTPRSIFSSDTKRRLLYHCTNDSYLIEVFDAEGNLLRKIDRPYERLPFTEKDAQDYYDSFADNPSQVYVEMAKDVELPPVKTVTDQLLVDDSGNLWVELQERIEQGKSELTAYDIFDPEGIYMAKIWTEIQPTLFKSGKMYTMKMDEEGYRILKRYRVKWEE